MKKKDNNFKLSGLFGIYLHFHFKPNAVDGYFGDR